MSEPADELPEAPALDASPPTPPPAPPDASPPRRRGRFILVGALCLAVGVASGVVITRVTHDHGAEAGESGPVKYQCPMHPSIIQDHPGNCPICGMKLVKMAAGTTAPSAGSSERRIAFYRSPMDPKQTSPTPRKDEMGMDYVPVYQDELAGGASSVPGMATVTIDPQRQQLIGLTTVEVVRGPVGGHLRTVGHVAVDETRIGHINVKNGGFVERVFVDFVGKRVKRGAPLFTYYSPELLAAEEELLSALRRRATAAPGAETAGADALVEASRKRLRLWDVSKAELARLEKSGTASRTITVYSPISGVVTKKDVFEGMKLEPGAMPYEIVDLGNLWVLADVYETELRLMREGLPATLELKAFPGRTFTGKVVFIDPFLDPNSRTVRVRLTFPNPTGELRPEMFGEVVLQTAPHDGVVIPFDAIIDSGTTKVVFVALGEGKLEPRQIEVGQSDGNTVEVLKGLAVGERVVTRANFLIDSESRLRASLDALARPAAPQPERARVLPPSGAEGATP